MDPEHEQDVQEKLHCDCVLGPVPFRRRLDVRLRLPVVFASTIQHSFKHHHQHEGEKKDDLGDREVVEIYGFGLFADVSTRDTFLEEQSVDEEDHEGEEIPVEVVAPWLHLVGVEGDKIGRLTGSQVAIRLHIVHVARLDLQEEVSD